VKVSAGPIVVLLLAAAAPLSPLPSAPWSVAALVLGALWLERFGLQLDGNYRLSPAAPVYLAMGMLPEVGPLVAAITLLVDGISRLGAPFWTNLGGKLAVAAGLLGQALLARMLPDRPELVLVLGPLVYLAVRLGLESQTRPPTSKEEALVWMQLHLRVRPLEAGLAAAAPALAATCQLSPLLTLALLPLLAATHLAAENVLLRSHDATLETVLKELKGAQVREKRAVQQLDETRRDKQLLEGFSAHIATNPTLSSTARNLVATLFELMPLDSAAVFLGSPPEPFFYRTSEAQTERLQGAGLTALREPLVDRAWLEKKPALQKEKPSHGERLLPDDTVAAAVPLAKLGVLYVARASRQMFCKKDLERLQWLAGKAQMALEAGYQANLEARQQRQQQQTVKELERKVAWLASLMGGAEAFASTLDGKILLERFLAVLQQMVPHARGALILPSGPNQEWGGQMRPDPQLVQTVRQAGRPLFFEDLAASRFAPPGPGLESLVASPLLAHQQCLGVVVLGAEQKRAFSPEQVDLLFVLCSQAAMALSNAAHFAEVVEARRKLEESQAQLVQSSKMTALGQLAAGVAHELNSPIGAIALCLDVASAQLLQKPDLAARLLVKGQEALERSKEIISRLLAYSRKPSHQPQPLSMRDLAKDTLDFLSFQLKDRQMEVQFQSDGEAIVYGEAQPLQQVLTNVILNAAQSVEEVPLERRRLELRISTEADAVSVQVADQGCGISDEQLPRIFEPFYTTKPIGKGTGLGLWATHQIVTEHGGDIAVASSVGAGSTFTIRLPRASRP
jgi:C4-dicarboxylate-specific signal transduction histidine kinase